MVISKKEIRKENEEKIMKEIREESMKVNEAEKMEENLTKNSDVIMYTSDDGQVNIEVRLEDEDAWLTKKSMAELFETTENDITIHIQNIFEEGELQEDFVSKECLLTAQDGQNYKTKFYNLDMIIAVGYRVKSVRATQFRLWTNKLIKEYFIKGYNLDSKRFKNNGNGSYFEELLEKIRDIRSSEKVFWRKVLDIFATSSDYDGKSEKAKAFFQTVQNKIHYATHKNTVAEVIYNRVDSNKENMGLTNFKGNMPTMAEMEDVKNYLTEEEVDLLNRMISAYLDIAEINALTRRVMTMDDWANELENFLAMTNRESLKNAGTVSHEEALKKAREEYDKYMKNHLTQAEKDYFAALGQDVQKIFEQMK